MIPMVTSRAVRSAEGDESEAGVRVVISDECLELAALSPAEVRTLRAWIGRVNGSTNIQPYLVEESPGRFRLYVGAAAERARTTKGLQ
jgi:hypothetical protein